MKKISFVLSAVILLLFSRCDQPKQQEPNTTVIDGAKDLPPVPKPIATTYSALSKDSAKGILSSYNKEELEILFAVNRTDSAHIVIMDSVLVPADMSGSVNQYSPFPPEVPYLKDVDKIIFFSYPAQYFAAYEHGRMVRSGATNMGRKKDPTPTGLFYANWKAVETKSTFNDEWELKWNFNIENKEGIGWHQYAMPGYPASHSCLRLTEVDAHYLYTWADEWKLKGTDDIIAQGTPVIVFGAYPFGSSKPWRQLLRDAHALDISAAAIEQQAAPHLDKILAEQRKTQQASNGSN